MQEAIELQKQASKSITTPPSMGCVARTVTLELNLHECRRDLWILAFRAAGPASRCAPAGRPTEAPNHLPYEVAQRRDLHEHVTHAASGECSSARAVGSRLQQARSFFPTAGAAAAVIVAAAGGAPSGLRRSGRSWRRGGATLG